MTLYQLRNNYDLRIQDLELQVKELRAVNAGLLEACKKMRRTMYSPTSEESIMADAAIAKAES